MIIQFEVGDLSTYRMDYSNPHSCLEPPDNEISIVDTALSHLKAAGILPHTIYDKDKLLAHRRAVRELFDIPWTAITPRVQRLLYAINAIAQPANMLAAGVFCGNTFISNAGAAVGPGACYTAKNLIGIEILTGEAKRAEQNVRRIDPTGVARVIAADAVEVVKDFPEEINLLYLDADGSGREDKGVYYDVLKAAYDKLSQGAFILAHNSRNQASLHQHYLNFVRDSRHFRASAHIVLDIEGLEVSLK